VVVSPGVGNSTDSIVSAAGTGGGGDAGGNKMDNWVLPFTGVAVASARGGSPAGDVDVGEDASTRAASTSATAASLPLLLVVRAEARRCRWEARPGRAGSGGGETGEDSTACGRHGVAAAAETMDAGGTPGEAGMHGGDGSGGRTPMEAAGVCSADAVAVGRAVSEWAGAGGERESGSSSKKRARRAAKVRGNVAPCLEARRWGKVVRWTSPWAMCSLTHTPKVPVCMHDSFDANALLRSQDVR